MQIKINLPFHKDYKISDVITIEDDGQGNPIDNFWFRRLQDSKFDKCIEVVDPENINPEGEPEQIEEQQYELYNQVPEQAEQE